MCILIQLNADGFATISHFELRVVNGSHSLRKAKLLFNYLYRL